MEKNLHIVCRPEIKIPPEHKPKRIYSTFGEAIDALSVIEEFCERHPESSKQVDIYTTQLIVLTGSFLSSGWRVFIIPFDEEKEEFEIKNGMLLPNGNKLTPDDDILKLLVLGGFGDRIVCR